MSDIKVIGKGRTPYEEGASSATDIRILLGDIEGPSGATHHDVCGTLRLALQRMAKLDDADLINAVKGLEKTLTDPLWQSFL